VAGCVEESDRLAIFKGDLVGTDMLGNTSGFPRHHVRTPDVVEQFGLTVVYMSHDCGNRRPVAVTGFVFFLFSQADRFLDFYTYEFDFKTELFSNEC